MIQPLEISNKSYAVQWLAETYERKAFGEKEPEFCTENGEYVRSKSEKIIADKLKTMGIPYKYERPLVLRTIGKVHPDFTVLNVRTREEFVWEHFGMMDDPGYCERNLGKIVAYEKDGFFLGKILL